jgi:hypothetical protein
MEFLPSLDSLLFDETTDDLNFISDFTLDPIPHSISNYAYPTLVHGPTVNLFVNLTCAGSATVQSIDSSIFLKLNHQSYRFTPSSVVRKDKCIHVQVLVDLMLRLQFSSPDMANEFYKHYDRNHSQNLDFASLVADAKSLRDGKILLAEKEYQAKLKSLHEMYPEESLVFLSLHSDHNSPKQDVAFDREMIHILEYPASHNDFISKLKPADRILDTGAPDSESLVCKICFDNEAKIRIFILQRLKMQSFDMCTMLGQFNKTFFQFVSLGSPGNLLVG